MRITLFIPCLVDVLLPQIGLATARVLSRLGHVVTYPPSQTCCGQPAFNAGHWEDARRVARHFLRTFASSRVVVCPSGSCVSMVRKHYLKLFAESPEELQQAREIGARVFELSEFLVRHLGVDDLGAQFHGRLTYHDSCHLKRELGIGEEPRQLIRAVQGAEFVEMEESDRCCGFGGIFSLKFPELSTAMVQRKSLRIQATRADAVVACDPGCLVQMAGYFQRERVETGVIHISQLLAT